MTDFRSDTVTRPTPAMLQAMLEADVGDDVFGDDPTINALQAEAADMLGFEAALFVSSGTQGNLIALMSQCERGDEVITGQMAHSYRWEAGGMAVLGSIQPQPIENEPDGTLALDKIRSAIKPDDPHYARTRLLTLENTISGRVLPAAYLEDAKALAKGAGLGLHLDGARLFNAAAALAVDGEGTKAGALPTADLVVKHARKICGGFDTVSVCLSKGLGCPVGSLLLGSAATIKKATRVRKMLGGGLRQAGFLAAAGRHALANHLGRLAADHQLADRLASGLQRVASSNPSLREKVRLSPASTNMVFVEVDAAVAEGLGRHLQRRGIRFSTSKQPDGGIRQRWVTHMDVGEHDVEQALAAWQGFGVSAS